MAPGGQTRRPRTRREEQAVSQDEAAPQERTEEVDELLDEIDEVLESNAEEFVRSYVQKGGE